MSDLISRCKLFNKLATAQTLADAFAVIQGMETEDAEYVVRCENCCFSDWYTAVDGNRYCYCMEHGSNGNKETDFCSRGERKDGERHD